MWKQSSGIASHASTVVLTGARSLTSYLRRMYEQRYHPRYRLARLAFGFDLFLLGVVAALGAFDLFFAFGFQPSTEPGLRLNLTTSPLRSSAIIPVEARIFAADGRTHHDVRLRWNLPPWVEVVRADPAISRGQEIVLGDVLPGQDVVSRMLLRPKAVPGTHLPFSFAVHESGWFGFSNVFQGTEDRIITTSAVRLEPLLPQAAAVSGASLPFLVTNESSATATLLTARILENEGAPAARWSAGDLRLVIKDLGPKGRRVVFLDLGEITSGTVRLAWELEDGAYGVSVGERELRIVPEGSLRVSSPLRSALGDAALQIAYTGSSTSSSIFVQHPALEGGELVGMFALTQGEGTVRIPLNARSTTESDAWSLVSVEDGVIGRRVMGRIGRVGQIIPFEVEARYYTASGDQIGIGPLPPKIGEQTSYWIVWTVGPIGSDLSNLVMRTTLPPSVRATGEFSSAVNGDFQTEGRSVIWTIPTLAATAGERATFAFEVMLEPTRGDEGKIVPLILESTVVARDAMTGSILESSAPSVSTDLMSDEKGKGKGIIE